MICRAVIEYKNNNYHLVKRPIQPHKDKEYETKAMFKGFEEINGKKHNRRIYKSKLNVPYLKADLIDIFQLNEVEIVEVYYQEHEEEEALQWLITYFEEPISNLKLQADRFLNNLTKVGSFVENIL